MNFVPLVSTWQIVGWYLAVMALSGALILMQSAWGLDEDYIQLVQFAPLAALALFAAFPSVRRMGSLRVHRGVVCQRLAIALSMVMAYALVFVSAASMLNSVRDEAPFSSCASFLMFLGLQFVGAFGEEGGWRGFLQLALEQRMSRLAACVVTGLMWSVWHVHMMTDPVVAIMFTTSTVALSILFGYIAIGNWWQRGLIAGVMHWGVNVALFVIVDPADELLQLLPLAVILLVPAGCITMAQRRRTKAEKPLNERIEA